jgi:UDP-N-acetylglucosamine--N-acetylmuramyl-(pentapeptide) pyrophosphoryl-undecaprenol N-acetylglucosamine transferase
VHVTWAGSPDRVEARLVTEAGIPFDPFRISGFPRKPGLKLARALGQAGMAPVACSRILARRKPDVVLGGGGYVAGPMVLAARLRGIPAALTEADAHLGLANRLAAPFARRLFLSFPVDGVDGPKVRVTGRPIPARSRAAETTREDARRLFGLPAEGPVVLVFGGSQGSRALNELVVAELGPDGPAVLHLCGERDHAALAPRVTRPGYRLIAFTNDFGAALAASDLVIGRSGGSVWEVAAAGLPAILVPFPFATADHQTKNARWFASGGGALVVPESELAQVPVLVRELLADPARLAAMREGMLALARPDAADAIAEELIALAG